MRCWLMCLQDTLSDMISGMRLLSDDISDLQLGKSKNPDLQQFVF